MASIVDTSVKHFHSGMTGSPVINGVAGSLSSALIAMLRDGFDTKTATSLVVSGGIATLTFSGSHSATVDSVILIDGSSIADLNGEQKVTSVSNEAVKFATAEADATATGTITFKMAPAGWLTPFTGTNVVVFKSADPTSTGMYFRLDDTSTTSARVVGYEAMLDVNTGSGPFPSPVQQPGGGYWGKAGVAGAVALRWAVFADRRTVLVHLAPYGTTAANTILAGVTRGFGDILSFRPSGDAYAYFINYSVSTSISTQIDGALDGVPTSQCAFPRPFTGFGSSELGMVKPYVGGVVTSGADSYIGDFPSMIDGGLRLSRRFFYQPTNLSARGDLPGLYHVPHSLALNSFKTLDIVSGTLLGRRLMALNPAASNMSSPSVPSSTGVSFVDITGPWR